MKLPLVFLPGMMCDARLFAPQFAAFSGNRTVISACISGHDSIEELAANVLGSLPDRFALAGLSMGGIVAMEMARQAPCRIAGLALMDTNPLAETEAVKTRRIAQIEAVKAGSLEQVMRDEMKPNYLADGANQGTILDVCMAMATDLGERVFVNQSVALRNRIDQSETLRNFRNPSIALCGEYDTLCPFPRHEMICDLLPNAELEIIRNAGHLPTLEQPAATNAALSRWLERI
ncbi:alpha/beta fold hydrolase [Shimia abyssi]|uniref:Pimeloyl-ACP methyl ester carboxylesterase n=1 Tax=Shimia abyssi TaxID=1662395 RepID=A0A2P8F2X9_9RHOB|nr:alpha/beta fold hydrolase [Shimia abyssi]PSL16075.1 pimeloyl-ACP methyl ester carboxylesterase [Shimia abyssi]